VVQANDLGLFIKMILSTGVVLGILLGLAALAKRGRLDGALSRVKGVSVTGGAALRRGRGRGRSGDDSEFNVLGRTMTGRETSLVWVRFGEEELLVAVGPQGGNLITKRTNPAQDTAAQGAGFEDSMRQAREIADVEDALAGTLVGSSLVERLRHATAANKRH
jgi:hypothetical protein